MSRVLGIDYASVDGNKPVDAVAAYASGVRFAYVRKGYVWRDPAHNTYHLAADQTYARDAAALRAAGIKVGAYSFWTYAKGGPSAAEQVANLVAAHGDIIPGVDLPPCSDVEFPGRGVIDTGRTQAECYQFTLELIDELRAAFGCWPMVYTSHVEWCDTNGLGGPRDLGVDARGKMRDCPLWIKIPYRHPTRRPLDVTTLPTEPHYGGVHWDPGDLWRVPPPWEASGWFMRQSQGDAVGAAGFSGTVDADDFQMMAPSATAHPESHWIQRRLNTTGAGLKVDGEYGARTSTAVQTLQATHGISATGVDLDTFCRLAWLPA